MYVVAKDDETWSVWSSFKNQGHKLIAGNKQSSVKVHIFWEDHKIYPLTFDWHYIGQK